MKRKNIENKEIEAAVNSEIWEAESRTCSDKQEKTAASRRGYLGYKEWI